MAFTLFKSGEDLWNLAYDHLTGSNGKSRDYTESAKIFEKAHKSGYRKKGYGPLAYLYYNGLGVDKDPKRAFDLCLDDIQNNREITTWGLRTSQYYLAFCYMEGKGTTKNTASAARMFKAAADNGHIESHYRYAKLVYKPVGTDMDAFFTARKYLKKALENGRNMVPSTYANAQKKYHEWFEGLSDEDCKGMDSAAIHKRAYNFQYGMDSYPEDMEEALRWYRKAVSLYQTEFAVNKTSAYNYALCLHGGFGVEKDLEKARQMLKKAAAMGDEDASELLYKWYPEEKDREMLAKADAANASHEAIIAAAVNCYDKGEHETAVRYAKKAIEKYGSPDGWAIYGIVSEYGHKPYRKDIVQAGKYYMSAAKCDTVPTVPKLRAFICEYLFKVIIQDEKEYSFDPEPAKYLPYLSRFINVCCDDGNIDAKRSRGVILYQGGEYDEAYSCLTEAFNETADIYAAKYLGALHFSVDSYKDMDKAAYYYRILVDKEFGTPLELGLYCRVILSRFPEGKDNTEDYQWYLRKGADYGNNFCKFSLGVYYAIGSNGFWKNTTKARELLMDLRDDPEFGENARKALTLL